MKHSPPGVNFGLNNEDDFSAPVIIAGPCSVESYEQLDEVARCLKDNSITWMRGGVYKLRTSPDSFQGLGKKCFDWIKEIKSKYQLKFITEVTDPRQIEELLEVADALQVGTRNMFNYALLSELGHTNVPIVLKRAFAARIKELLLAAEYITQQGNQNVILCERGIRSFETETRNTMDLGAIAWVKANTPWTIFADPSHGTGLSELVTPMAHASLAAGADGLLVEVHPEPKKALSDSRQALDLNQLKILSGLTKQFTQFKKDHL